MIALILKYHLTAIIYYKKGLTMAFKKKLVTNMVLEITLEELSVLENM